MSVLLLAEIANGQLVKDLTAKTINAGRQIGDVTVLCIGENLEKISQDVATLEGVSKVLTADHQTYKNGLAEPHSELIISISSQFEYIIAPATTHAKNVLPRVAALLDVMIIPDVVSIEDKNTFKRPVYAGNAIQTVTSGDNTKVLTIRTTAFDPVTSQNELAPSIEQIDHRPSGSHSKWIDDLKQTSERPDLTAAKVVISGGRGVGSEENFQVIEKLADKLNGAVGASRAAVDSGFAPNDLQVGQTGKIVAPDLYIAAGISGAIQHLAGMKDSKVIVAINKDEEAPIFQIADYGLVADLFDAVPKLTDAL